MKKDLQLSKEYLWSPSGTVGSLQTEPLDDGRVDCVIYPTDNANYTSVQILMNELNKLSDNRDTYIGVVDDKAAVIVPDVEHVSSVLNVLNKTKTISGIPVINETEIAEKTIHQKIDENMMNIGGAVGLIGHLALMTKGVVKGQLDVFGSGLGILNPVTQTVLGNGNHSRKYERLVSRMQDHLLENGVLDDKSLEFDHNKSVLNSAMNFVEENPQLIGFGLGNLGAISMLYNSFDPSNTNQILDRLISTTSIIGNCAVMFMPERKFSEFHESPDPFKEPVKALWEFAQKDPLKFNGLLNASDNFCWGIKVVRGFQNPQVSEFDKWNTLVTGVSFGLSTLIVSFLSSKGQSEDATQMEFDKVYDLTATILKDLPPEQREPAVEQMVGYLSTQPIIVNSGLTIEEIADGVRERVALFDEAKWTNNDLANRINADGPSRIPSESVEAATIKSDGPLHNVEQRDIAYIN